MKKNEKSVDKKTVFERQEEKLRPTVQRRTHDRYQNRFNGYCFFCYNYGHKATFCDKFSRKINEHNGYEKSRHRYGRRLDTSSQKKISNTYNIFDTLNYETKCYKCQNFGHISRNYPTTSQKFRKPIYTNQQAQIWKRKSENLKAEICNVALQA